MNPSHGLSWEKSGEQEGVFATLFILTGKLGKYKLSTCGFFSINLVVGSNMVSVDKLVSGSLPQTPYTLFTVISQGTSLKRLIDIFFDGDNNLVAYTNVAQRYSVMWVSFEMA